MSQDAQQRLLMTIDETRTTLGGISRTQLWKLSKAGEVTQVNIGTRAFFTVKSVEQYVDRLAGVAAGAA